MRIETVSTKVNPLLSRKEIGFEIRQPSTPSRVDVTKELAALLKVTSDRVCVVELQTRTGAQITRGKAHIYDTAALAQSIEARHIMKRNNKVKEEKKEED